MQIQKKPLVQTNPAGAIAPVKNQPTDIKALAKAVEPKQSPSTGLMSTTSNYRGLIGEGKAIPSDGTPANIAPAVQAPTTNFDAVKSPYALGGEKAVSSLPAQKYQAEDGQVADGGLVENRINGLMDLNNPLMKKSIVNANNLSAQRGLQSSSIATENAVNSMYNFALPIAQQDAQTIAQQGFINQDKRQQLGMEDNRALNQQALNESQNQFTATENQVQRDFSVELEGLRQQNNLGLLTAESQRRLQEMEQQNTYAIEQMNVNSTIQKRRDQLLQSFQGDNMAMELANQLQMLEAQAQESRASQDNQNNFARQMEYSNAVSNAVNFGIEALGNAMMNPEITPSQYTSISANINAMVQGQITNYQDIYGINIDPQGSTSPPRDIGPQTGVPSPMPPQIPSDPTYTQPGTGGIIGENPNIGRL